MSDWPSIIQAMVSRWPNVDWRAWRAAGVLDQFTADLADLDLAQVAAAMDVLAREGRDWPPRAGHVRQKVIELTVAAPSWAETKSMIVPDVSPQPLGRQRTECPLGECDGSGWLIEVREDEDAAVACPCRVERIRSAKVRSGLVAEFVAEVGPGEFRGLGSDRTVEAQVRVKYEAFVARKFDQIRTRGLPDAGLPGLQGGQGQIEAGELPALRRVA